MDKKEIKDKILTEIERTQRLIEEYRELSGPVAPDVAIGRISRMDAINNKSITEAALRQAEEKLSKLNFVLSMVDDDSFGKCARCGTLIPLGRILIKPESSHCVNCAR